MFCTVWRCMRDHWGGNSAAGQPNISLHLRSRRRRGIFQMTVLTPTTRTDLDSVETAAHVHQSADSLFSRWQIHNIYKNI